MPRRQKFFSNKPKQAGKKRSPAPSFALVRGKKGVGKMPQHQNRAWCWIKIFKADTPPKTTS